MSLMFMNEAKRLFTSSLIWSKAWQSGHLMPL